MQKTIELLAPAGDEASAYAAIDAGANAVYLGLKSFSARSGAENFDVPALERLVARAHFFGVKIFVAMNTLVKESELEDFVNTAIAVHNAGADAIIVQDVFLGAYLKKQYPQLTLHLSTQAGVCNAYGARLAKELGFSRVILARETAFADIKAVSEIIETEVFIQGALCTCFSGQCYFSSFAGGNSGNRGKCKQPCRKKYKIDREGFDEYAYRLSLSDLSVGEDIEKLVSAGVTSFKIEGRMRRPEYVAAAVKYYKAVLGERNAEEELSALKRTYNRGNYTAGLGFGQDKSFISSAVQGHIGEFVGTVAVENGKYICRTGEKFTDGDGFKILRQGKEICGATYGGEDKRGVILSCRTRLKAGDKVFITTDTALNRRLLAGRRTEKIQIFVEAFVGQPFRATVNGRSYEAEFTVQEAKGRPVTQEDIETCFKKVDVYPIEVENFEVATDGRAFIPLSLLNAFRRRVYEDFYRSRSRDIDRIERVLQLPTRRADGVKNKRTCVIAGSLGGVTADIGVLKPDDYFGDLTLLVKGFSGEKYLYLPPFLTGEKIARLKTVIKCFDGIYSGGNYAVLLAEELNLKLFAGTGFNLSNSVSLAECPADKVALSKELTAEEAKPLCGANTFYFTGGDIALMDLIYCPFGKTCNRCDKRSLYTLTDEDGRSFTLRRYGVDGCRFEIYNCADLVCGEDFTGRIYEYVLPREIYKEHTRGHSRKPIF